MIEITNKMQCPVQLVVRSRRKSRAFTTLNVPGRGNGKNKVLLEDERTTEYIDRAVQAGLITVNYVSDAQEGE